MKSPKLYLGLGLILALLIVARLVFDLDFKIGLLSAACVLSFAIGILGIVKSRK